MFGGSKERRQKAMDDYWARLRARMDEEVQAGTVFFCGPVETLRREFKVTPKKELVYIVRAYTGGEDMEETRAYRLKSLESWGIDGGELVISGVFLYDHDDCLWGVREGRSRPVRKRFGIPLPLDNTDVLREFLGDMMSRAGDGGVSDKEIRGEFVRKGVLEPAAGVGLAMATPSIWAAWAVAYAKTEGVLEGLEVIGGRHYARFSFTARDGSQHSSVDMRHPLESTHDDVAILRMVNAGFPRKVTVRYRRSNPEDCYCDIS